MLKSFAVTNFKGFKDRILFDLSKHKNYEFNTFAIKNGIVKDAIIYGPNGSGKSNIGFAIFDIVNHLTQKWKEPSFYNNAIFAGNRNALMTFEYYFDFEGENVEYCYSKNSQNILVQERLIVDSAVVFDKAENSFSIDESKYPMTADVKLALTKNANSISIINFLLTSYPLLENHYLNKLKSFVDSMLWFRCLEDRGFMGLKTEVQYIEEFIISNNLVEDFHSFLKEVSEQDFVFKKHKTTDKVLICLVDGTEIPFNVIRSTGTSSLTLLYYWLKNLEASSFLFIDEFDAFYHYKLSAAVCKRLFSLQCQVVLTSHNTYLMSNEILRPDCNFVIDNNKITALCDCTDKELRWGHNIEKLFRGGAFEQ